MATYIFPVTHPAPELITLTEAKKQCKIELSFIEEDDLIAGYILAAISQAENYTGTNINQAKFKLTSNGFQNNYAFKRSPISAIDSVKYFDETDTEQTLDVEKFELRPLDKYQHEIFYENFSELPNVITNKSNAVTINITCGYDADTLPKAIKQAVLLLIGTFYENRQDSVEALPKASTNLLRKYRFHY